MSEACSIAGVTDPSSGKAEKKASPDFAHKAGRSVSVEEGYQLWATTYDTDPNPLLALEARSLLPRLPDCRGKGIVEVGCGTGRWLGRLINRGPRWALGVDFSPAMLEIAASKPLIRGHLARGDAQFLPLQSRVADLIISSFVLSHIADATAFARELARVAKPKAEVVVSDLHPDAHARGWHTGFRSRNGPIEIASIARTLDQMLDDFVSQGLRLVEFGEFHLGEPERLIFIERGKSHLFDAAAASPAVLICHFERSPN